MVLDKSNSNSTSLEEHISHLEKLLEDSGRAKDYFKLDIDAINGEIQSMQDELRKLSQETNTLRDKYFKLESSSIDYVSRLKAIEQAVKQLHGRDTKSAVQAKEIVYNFLYIILSAILGYYVGQIGRW